MLKFFLIAVIGFAVYALLFAIISTHLEGKWKARESSEREKEAKKAGEKFEHFVSKKLEKLFGIQVLQNIVMEFKNGFSMEIDQIFVSPKGVFVIECKSRSYPHIIGVLTEEKWHNGEFEFENPCIQNAKHIRTLSQLSLFPKKSRIFHNIIITNAETEVIHFGKGYKGDLIKMDDFGIMVMNAKSSGGFDFFANAMAKLPDILTPAEVNATVNALRKFQADEETRARHANNVKARH